MFNDICNKDSFLINKEFEKFKNLILTDLIPLEENKKLKNNFYGIESFWIITRNGICLYSNDESLFQSANDKNLFAGFISAVTSLSEYLSRHKLSEIKIENISLHIQFFNNLLLVSTIAFNTDVSLKLLNKFANQSELFSDQYQNQSTRLLDKEYLDNLYISLYSDENIKKELLYHLSNEYMVNYLFDKIDFDLLFKKITRITKYADQNLVIDFINNFELFYKHIVKANSADSDKLKLILKLIEFIRKFNTLVNKKPSEIHFDHIVEGYLFYSSFFQKIE